MSIYLPAGSGQQNTVAGATSDKTFNSGSFVTSYTKTESHKLSETDLLAKKLGLIEYDIIQEEYIHTGIITNNFMPKKNHKRFTKKRPADLNDRIKAELYRLNSKYKSTKLIRSKNSKRIAIQKDDFNSGIYLVYEYLEKKLRPSKNEISLKQIRQICASKVSDLIRSANPDKKIQITITEQNVSDTLRLYDKIRD